MVAYLRITPGTKIVVHGRSAAGEGSARWTCRIAAPDRGAGGVPAVRDSSGGFLRILIGVDDSAHSRRALEFVSKVRWPAGSTVVVASVVRPVFGGGNGGDDSRAKLHTDLVERAGQRPRDAGLATETRVLEGEPGDTLVAAAKAERCDLLVVGSRGHRGLKKLLLGSVASHVLTHAGCSVLVVKAGER